LRHIADAAAATSLETIVSLIGATTASPHFGEHRHKLAVATHNEAVWFARCQGLAAAPLSAKLV